MAADEFYRNSARRIHRTLGAYLVQWAWMNGVDCVAVRRSAYLRFVGIKTMQEKRIEWLKDDLRSVFPHSAALYLKGKKWSTIWFSRLPFPPGFAAERLTVDRRLQELRQRGLRADSVTIPTERIVIEAMARVATGIEDFGDAPWAKATHP